MKDTLGVEYKGHVQVIVKDKDGVVLRTREYENLWTNQCRNRILNTLLQVTGGGDMLNATGYIKKLAFCEGAYPSSPRTDPLGGSPHYETLSTLAAITSGSGSCYGTKTASYTNSSGSTVTITYLAGVYADSVAYTNVFTIVDIDDEDVEDGQTMTVNYTWQVNYSSSQEI